VLQAGKVIEDAAGIAAAPEDWWSTGVGGGAAKPKGKAPAKASGKAPAKSAKKK
jgi:hypothetical protein